MERSGFSTAALPAELSDDRRFSHWQEVFESAVCCVDVGRAPHRPFRVDFDVAHVDAARVSRMSGMVRLLARTPTSISRGPDDNLCIIINESPSTLSACQRGRQSDLQPGNAVLVSNGEPVELLSTESSAWSAVTLSRAQMNEFGVTPEDLVARPFTHRHNVARLLHGYLASVLALDSSQVYPALERHIGTTITDLIALLLNFDRDTVELAKSRGLRSARRREIIAAIKDEFSDHAFSSERVARRLGLSRRYVNELLAETGVSFEGRVLELRLQKAAAMLADINCDRLKVGDIALMSGFNEVSYFNRRFRARFGCSPTQYRAGKIDG